MLNDMFLSLFFFLMAKFTHVLIVSSAKYTNIIKVVLITKIECQMWRKLN